MAVRATLFEAHPEFAPLVHFTVHCEKCGLIQTREGAARVRERFDGARVFRVYLEDSVDLTSLRGGKWDALCFACCHAESERTEAVVVDLVSGSAEGPHITGAWDDNDDVPEFGDSGPAPCTCFKNRKIWRTG